MNYILFDDDSWRNLLPLTFTKPSSEIRVGILKIKEKWEFFLNTHCSYLTQDYLAEKYPKNLQKENILINGSIIPDEELAEKITRLKNGETLVKKEIIIAANLADDEIEDFKQKQIRDIDIMEYSQPLLKIDHPWHIFQYNGEAIKRDFELLTKNRESAPVSETNNLLGKENVFFEPGAKAEFATINATKGPVYI